MKFIHSFFISRHIIRWLLVLWLCVQAGLTTLSAQSLSRDVRVDVHVNQIGYTPGAEKQAVMPGSETVEFEVRRLPSNEEVYRGMMESAGGDFGAYRVGDFSGVTVPGTYYIKTDSARSYPFRISPDIYEEAMGKILSYFGAQRCGASATGYLAPCHLDDGVRLDNGQHQDVSGGWHDASDLRKGVANTIYGMIGFTNLLEIMPHWHTGRILEELRWGNKYFLKMQEPAGYVMRSIGSEVQAHADENRWTDNDIGPEEGSLHTVASTMGTTDAPLTIFGSKDDRVIKTQPAFDVGQFMFIVSEVKLARLTRKSEPAYAEMCLAAAKNCFNWVVEEQIADNAGDYAAFIQAAVALYKATGEDRYREQALAQVEKLLQLQVKDAVGSDPAAVRGFFRTSASNSDPYRPISDQPVQAIEGLPLLGLSILVEAFPEHEDARVWKEAISLYAQDYLLALAHQNSFGIVPFALYAEAPGGDRRAGPYWYRYFMQPEDWWVGINANLAMKGVGLMKAARILDDSRLAALAQRQLDWIVGANPFNSSTIDGVGYNHPEQFINGSEFRPPTPRITGAVMNGLGGTEQDQPALYDGSYHTAEYWTPMVAYTLWLMAELQLGI